MGQCVQLSIIIILIACQGMIGSFDFYDGFEDFGNNDGAKIVPMDANMFVGDKIRIYCSSDDISNSSTIFFELTYKKSNQIVELKNFVVNSTHAAIDFEATEEMKGLITLTCYERPQNELLATLMNVQERLKNVTNITSIWRYHLPPVDTSFTGCPGSLEDKGKVLNSRSDEVFEVSWDLGVQYYRPHYNIKVDTTWIANDRTTNEDARCNCTIAEQLTCKLNIYKYQTILFFHITVGVPDFWWKLYKDNKEYFLTPQVEFPHLVYEVKPKLKVQPGKPKDVKIDGITSQSFNISWTNPDYFIHFKEDVMYQISVSTQEADHSLSQANNSGLAEGLLSFQANQSLFTFTPGFKALWPKLQRVVSKLEQSMFGIPFPFRGPGLHPFTSYEVTLQLKPVEEGHWSEAQVIPITTAEDRPTRGPEMTSSSYWMGMCNKGQRDIILYWKTMSQMEANGVLTNFIIYFNSEPGEVRSSNNHLKATMSCDVTYDIEVYSATAIGPTLDPSKLTIPSEKDAYVPPPVDLKVEKLELLETGHVNLKIQWTAQDNASFQGVSIVLYYCQGQKFTREVCLDDFSFIKMPFEKQFLVLQNIAQTADRYGFALEKDSKHVTGIKWIDCIYDRNEKPTQVKVLKAHPGEVPRSILVMWEAQRCSKETLALVKAYYIDYCTIRTAVCNEIKVVGGEKSSFVLSDLDADEEYKIRVRAEAEGGKGLYTEFVTSKPNVYNEDDDISKELTIVIICLILLVFVSAAGVFFVCRFKNRKAKVIKGLPEYTAFDVASPKQKTERMQSDSGISTESTTVVNIPEIEEIDPYATIAPSNSNQNDINPLINFQHEVNNSLQADNTNGTDLTNNAGPADVVNMTLLSPSAETRFGTSVETPKAKGNSHERVTNDIVNGRAQQTNDSYVTRQDQPSYVTMKIVDPDNANAEESSVKANANEQRGDNFNETHTDLLSHICVPDLACFPVGSMGNLIESGNSASNQSNPDPYITVESIGNPSVSGNSSSGQSSLDPYIAVESMGNHTESGNSSSGQSSLDPYIAVESMGNPIENGNSSSDQSSPVPYIIEESMGNPIENGNSSSGQSSLDPYIAVESMGNHTESGNSSSGQSSLDPYIAVESMENPIEIGNSSSDQSSLDPYITVESMGNPIEIGNSSSDQSSLDPYITVESMGNPIENGNSSSDQSSLDPYITVESMGNPIEIGNSSSDQSSLDPYITVESMGNPIENGNSSSDQSSLDPYIPVESMGNSSSDQSSLDPYITVESMGNPIENGNSSSPMANLSETFNSDLLDPYVSVESMGNSNEGGNSCSNHSNADPYISATALSGNASENPWVLNIRDVDCEYVDNSNTSGPSKIVPDGSASTSNIEKAHQDEADLLSMGDKPCTKLDRVNNEVTSLLCNPDLLAMFSFDSEEYDQTDIDNVSPNNASDTLDSNVNPQNSEYVTVSNIPSTKSSDSPQSLELRGTLGDQYLRSGINNQGIMSNQIVSNAEIGDDSNENNGVVSSINGDDYVSQGSVTNLRPSWGRHISVDEGFSSPSNLLESPRFHPTDVSNIVNETDEETRC